MHALSQLPSLPKTTLSCGNSWVAVTATLPFTRMHLGSLSTKKVPSVILTYITANAKSSYYWKYWNILKPHCFLWIQTIIKTFMKNNILYIIFQVCFWKSYTSLFGYTDKQKKIQYIMHFKLSILHWYFHEVFNFSWINNAIL